MGVFLDIPKFNWEAVGLGARSSVDLGTFREVNVGEGSTAIKMDNQGLWVGGETFAEAPMRTDMDGTTIYTDPDGYDRILIGYESGGF